MSSLSRLSDKNIADPILRAHYYQRVIEYIDLADSDLVEYTIKPDEQYRPDLVAYRALGSSELAWLVALVCEVDDVAEPLPVGAECEFPQAGWVRTSMREFMDEFGLL
ncbi:baseplate protein [Vibrio metschnikovii]|uniref:baseplate protein n=1 Tax=Vibrio metschnikovii TaxID=28172 RepID=UPI001C2FE66F|nr:baseplate protein [Vibrio metschnikovii]